MSTEALEDLDVYLNRPSFRAESIEEILDLRRLLSSDHSVFDLRKIVPPPAYLETIRERVAAVPEWFKIPTMRRTATIHDVSFLSDSNRLDELTQWLNWAHEHWGAATLLCKPAIVAEGFEPPQLTYEFFTNFGPPYEALVAIGDRFPTLKCSWDYWDPIAKSWKWMGFDDGPPVTWQEVLEHSRARREARRKIH